MTEAGGTNPAKFFLMPRDIGARWLPECLDGILGYIFSAFEAVIVDGSSKDRAVEIRQDDGIILQMLPGRRLASYLNIGIEETHVTTWSDRIDSGDVCEPLRLERKITKIKPALGQSRSAVQRAVTGFGVAASDPKRYLKYLQTLVFWEGMAKYLAAC
jgi:glycosyltransferase involved in cell wall biosynthesis